MINLGLLGVDEVSEVALVSDQMILVDQVDLRPAKIIVCLILCSKLNVF